MAGEWFRSNRVNVLIGIRRVDLNPVLLSAGVLSSLDPVLEQHTEREPLHVTLRDQGYTDPNATPFILAMEALTVQIDGGLNEVPRATVEMAIGRDVTSLEVGANDITASSVFHILERYLNDYIPVRVYERIVTTAGAGEGDIFDNTAETGEWKVIFDGLATGIGRRGSAEASRAVLHLVHFTGALSFSSTLSSAVAAGSAPPWAFPTALFPALVAGSGVPFTQAGVVAAGIAGGPALYTDFWGYDVPAGAGLPATGVKGFLTRLADTDVFDWQMMRRTTGGALSVPTAPRNTGALAALSRIEPIWPAWQAADARGVWKSIQDTVTGVRTARAAAGSGRAVDRADIAGNAYYSAGYRYGVPVSFYLNDAALGPYAAGKGFGMDIAGATFEHLGGTSFWELIAAEYPARYQIALAPMADRAVVMPAAPILDGVWQTIAASEVFGWEDDTSNPVPLRGVILVGSLNSWAGSFVQGENPSANMFGFSQGDAVFDSGMTGVFEFRRCPEWLAATIKIPATHGPANLSAPKAVAPSPTATAPFAAAAGSAPAAAALQLNAVAPGAVTAPGDVMVGTANRLAKSYWQQLRLSNRTVFVTGRYRTDIGPGSIVNMELPADKYVRAAVGGNRDSVLRGMVLRVTLHISSETMTATTAFQVGFVRTEGETLKGRPTWAESHPWWATAVYGIPFADSLTIRQQLGDSATLRPDLLPQDFR